MKQNVLGSAAFQETVWTSAHGGLYPDQEKNPELASVAVERHVKSSGSRIRTVRRIAVVCQSYLSPEQARALARDLLHAADLGSAGDE